MAEKKKYSCLVEFVLMCMAVGLLCGMIVFILIGLHFISGPTSARGAITYIKSGQRSVAQACEKYRAEFGIYPPQGQVGQYYGWVTTQLLAPIPTPAAGPQTHGGSSLLDPYRRYKLFPNDEWETFVYDHRQGPDRFRGYHMRYFRSSDGKLAFVVSNGPSWYGALKESDLAAFRSDQSPEEIARALAPLTYDPTNGTDSPGDVWRLINAAEYARYNNIRATTATRSLAEQVTTATETDSSTATK